MNPSITSMDVHNARLERVKVLALVLVVMGSGFSVSLCGIGLGAYLIALILQVFIFRKENIESFPYFPLFLILFSSLVVSVYISSYFFVSLKGLLKYIEGFFLLYAVIDFLNGRARLKALIGTFLLVMFVAGSDGVVQEIAGHDLFYGREPVPHKITFDPARRDLVDMKISRITGPFKHSNDFATFLLTGFFVILSTFIYFFESRRWALSGLMLAVIAVVSYSMVRTLSMGMFVGFFAALIFFVCAFKFRWWALGVVAAGIISVVVIPSDFSARLQNVINFEYGNTHERVLLFKTALSMVETSPLFGLGLNTYSKHFQDFKPQDYPAAMYAHNAYIQMAAEAGWVGLGFYLLYIGRILVACIRKLTDRLSNFRKLYLAAFLAAIVGYLVNCLFDSCLQSTQLRTLFWLLMGFAFILARHPERFDSGSRSS